MQIFTFILLIVRLSILTSALSVPLIIHEKRDEDSVGPQLARRRIEKDALLPMRIALVQNQHAELSAEKWLMDVSQPGSKQYGRHWTQQEVVEAFQPSLETIRNVTLWLHDHHIYDFTHSSNKQWFAFDLPASRAEQLLNAEYFEHMTEDGEFEASCDYYYVPEHLQSHIHYVKPGVQKSVVTGRTRRSRRHALHKRQTLSAAKSSLSVRDETTNGKIPPGINATSLENCWKAVTPACIRALNKITVADPTLPVSPKNSLGLFEYFVGLYYQPSLNAFFRHFAPDIPQGTSPIFEPIAGNEYPRTKANYTTDCDFDCDDYEAELDLQIALPIIYPQNATTLNQETGAPIDALNIWLDAIDGSYCSVKQPPDSGNGTLQCGIYTPPYVLSVSYDIGESAVSPRALERQCNEYLKLGLQGHSIFFASGDSGVGVTALNMSNSVCNPAKGGRIFGPYFPASCPWITSVGATMISEDGSVHDAETGAEWFSKSKRSKNTFSGASGGGFSNTFKPPSYQKDALDTFFKKHNPPWPYYTNGSYLNSTGRYNRNGRGYPDVAAVGTNVVDFLDVKYGLENGTSCAAPLIASMFVRINDERIRAGKGPLGFVNPVLYQHPEMFKDVVKGGNGFCDPDQGFQAVPGWDPVTGLGIPLYPKLRDVFMNLD